MYSEIGTGVYMIDAHLFGAPENLSTYVFPEPVPTLVEPGPTTSHDAVVAGLAALGVTDIAQVVVTHVHLDHAGGTGNLLKHFPAAEVYVHEIGASHLVDPSRLIASAERIYGRDGMRDLWGEITAVDATHLHAVADGDTIPIGPNRHLQVMYTPGHAKHHMSLLDSATGIALIGDSVGLTYPEMDIIQPVVPPPDVDVGLLVSQFSKYRERDVRVLAFAHFGLKTDVDKVLDESERRLHMWTQIAERHREKTPDDVAARIEAANTADLRTGAHPEEHIRRINDRTTYATDAAGLLRYVHTHGSDRS